MKRPGIVTNVIAFGAFVDIGMHQDAARPPEPVFQQLREGRFRDPGAMSKNPHYHADIDLLRNRIALSMKRIRKLAPKSAAPPAPANAM